jgi:hypothetical protein
MSRKQREKRVSVATTTPKEQSLEEQPGRMLRLADEPTIKRSYVDSEKSI